MSKIFKNIEIFIGSIAISITVITVILNVILRYGFGIQFAWVEEVSVGCFVWAVFLGAAASYREKSLIGVEVLTASLPPKPRRILELVIYIFLFVLNSTLFYLSFNYTKDSNKITSALEISYVYINSALVVSFGLMTIHSFIFLVEDIKLFFSKEIKAEKEMI